MNTTQDRNTSQELAVQAALAITNAQLYQEKKRALQEARVRAAQFQHQTAIVEEWKRRYEAAITATGQILYDWDTQTNKAMWGGQSKEILGYPAAEMPTTLAETVERIHPADQAAFLAEIARVCATQTSFHLVYRLRRKDGQYRIVEDKGCFFVDRNGASTRMVGFVTDITERTQAAQALQESETRFRRLVESNIIGIIITGPHQILEANDVFLDMLGYTREELEAGLLQWSTLTPPEYPSLG